MMNKSFKEKEIKRWWDAKRQLRWKNIYNGEDYASLALNNREKIILHHPYSAWGDLSLYVFNRFVS